MKKGRHKKVRYVQAMPKITQFSPRGKPGRPDEVELRVEHFEAIKLADYQGYDQTAAAKLMGVSRPTFGRSLREARKIMASALVEGKIIHIRMGDVQVGVRRQEVDLKGVVLEESVRKKILSYPAENFQSSPVVTGLIKER